MATKTPKTLVLDDVQLESLKELSKVKAEIKPLASRERKLSDTAKLWFKAFRDTTGKVAEVAYDRDGNEVATYLEERDVLDSQLLKAELPDVYKKYTRKCRILRISVRGDDRG